VLKVECLNKIPTWWKERNYYDLVLSNDIDSFMSCEVLQEIKGWKINYFYSFHQMSKTKDAHESYIGVDIALRDGKCFDNHVVKLKANDSHNKESINLNIVDNINRSNYFQKYCGSTLLMIWSLYDIPLPKTEEGKMVLLAIDGTYKGYYSRYANDNRANKNYLVDVMGLYELYDVLEKHRQKDFIDLIEKYQLAGKIKLKDGYLQTNIDFESLREIIDLPFLLPKKQFYIKECYEVCTISIKTYGFKISKNVISLALTKRDFLNYSKKIYGGCMS